jgi:hypothetical protein
MWSVQRSVSVRLDHWSSLAPNFANIHFMTLKLRNDVDVAELDVSSLKQVVKLHVIVLEGKKINSTTMKAIGRWLKTTVFPFLSRRLQRLEIPMELVGSLIKLDLVTGLEIDRSVWSRSKRRPDFSKLPELLPNLIDLRARSRDRSHQSNTQYTPIPIPPNAFLSLDYLDAFLFGIAANDFQQITTTYQSRLPYLRQILLHDVDVKELGASLDLARFRQLDAEVQWTVLHHVVIVDSTGGRALFAESLWRDSLHLSAEGLREVFGLPGFRKADVASASTAGNLLALREELPALIEESKKLKYVKLLSTMQHWKFDAFLKKLVERKEEFAIIKTLVEDFKVPCTGGLRPLFDKMFKRDQLRFYDNHLELLGSVISRWSSYCPTDPNVSTELLITHDADINSVLEWDIYSLTKLPGRSAVDYLTRIPALFFKVSDRIDADCVDLARCLSLPETLVQPDIEAIKYLLLRGANPSAYLIGGDSALSIALKRGYLGIANLLLEHGADPNGPSAIQPLARAVRPDFIGDKSEQIDIIKALVACNADVLSKSGVTSESINLSVEVTRIFGNDLPCLVVLAFAAQDKPGNPLKPKYHKLFDAMIEALHATLEENDPRWDSIMDTVQPALYLCPNARHVATSLLFEVIDD